MSKPNIQIILYKSKPKKDGTFPIVLRITKNRKRRYIFTKYYAKENEWDPETGLVRKNHPNSLRLNNLLKKKMTEAEDIIIDTERDKKDLNAVEIKQKIKGENGGSFYELTREYLKTKLKRGKQNQYVADKSKFKSFRDFLEKEGIGSIIETKDENGEKSLIRDINIKSISISIIKKYQLHLEVDLGVGQTTIYNKLNVLRILYNKAIEEELIDGKDYPFGRGNKKLQIKPAESMKIGLDENELKTLENVSITKNNIELISFLKEGVKYIKNLENRMKDLEHARNVFLFSFYFAGIRCEDTLKSKWSDFKNGRYYYYMGKNSKPVSVPVSDKVNQILKFYDNNTKSVNGLIFPDLEKANFNDPKDLHRKVRTANRKINSDLALLAKYAKINKTVSMHIARHTFGNLSKGEIAPEVLQLLYRHSNISTTINYQKNWIKQTTLDEGLLKVINFINK